MLKAKMIICDDFYIPKVKAKGYKIGKIFEGVKFRSIPIISKFLLKSLDKWFKHLEQERTELQQWLYNNLLKIEIDLEAALEYLDGDEHYDIFANQCIAISNKQWFFHVDDYGRIHTNLTNLPTDCRKFIKVKNKHLSGVDISNSQPLFLSIIYNNQFKYNQDPSTFIMCDVIYLDDRQISEYQKDCESGQIYQRIADLIGKTREEVKHKVLASFYCDPEKRKSPEMKQIIEAMNELYPDIMAYTLEVRKSGYEKLAHNMQREESSFMFNKVCQSLKEQHPDMFLATIHDSIICEPENLAFVEHTMRWQFNCLEVKPALKIEALI